MSGLHLANRGPAGMAQVVTVWLTLAAAVSAQQTPPQEPKIPPAAQQEAANDPTAALAQQNAQAVDRIADQLVQAMDQLIPGEFAQDSPILAGLKQSARTLLTGDAEAAKKPLEELKQANPTLPPVQLLMAGMYFALNQGEPGRLALEQAALDHPEYPGTFTALARLSINQGWWSSAAALLAQLRQKIDAGNWSEEEKKHFESEYLDALADTAIGQRRFDAAREHLMSLQQMLPTNASAPFRLADIDFRQGNVDGALANLIKARELDKNVFPAELVLYQWSERLNKNEDAQRWIQAAAEKHPDEVTVQLEYARYLLEKNDLTHAAEWVSRAEKNTGAAQIARFLRGQIAFMRRAYQVAEADFRELMIIAPNDWATRNMLALCLIESDDSAHQQKALELANGNYRFNPSSAEAAATLAWVMYQLGNSQQARQMFQQLSARQQVPADTAYYISRLLTDDGQDEEAAKILRDSLNTPGLFLYRSRAEEDLAAIEKRLAGSAAEGKKSGDDKE